MVILLNVFLGLFSLLKLIFFKILFNKITGTGSTDDYVYRKRPTDKKLQTWLHLRCWCSGDYKNRYVIVR
jgi:hypothetical protein